MAEPTIFSDVDLTRIEGLAAGLSRTEILDIYYIGSIDELNHIDSVNFEKSYRKGRALAKATAVNALFSQMNSRDGIKGSLSYLIRFGEEWPNIEEESSKNGQHVFKFTINKDAV
jgi:hypothetical protein